MASAGLYTLWALVVLLQLSTVTGFEEQEPKLANIHMLFVPEKAMNALKDQGLNDPNKWNALQEDKTTNWEAVHLPGGKVHSFEVNINPKKLNKVRIEFRKLQINGAGEGLEMKLKDVPLLSENSSGNNLVEFFKDCYRFIHNSSSPEQTHKRLSYPAQSAKGKNDNNSSLDMDAEPLLLPYDLKFLSNLKATIVKYVPLRDDGTLRWIRKKDPSGAVHLLPSVDSIKKQIKRGDISNNKKLLTKGCIRINMRRLTRDLTDAHTRLLKRLSLAMKPTGKPAHLKIVNDTNIAVGVSGFTSLVHQLGLKMPNDTESTNNTLIKEKASDGVQNLNKINGQTLRSNKPGFAKVKILQNLVTNPIENSSSKIPSGNDSSVETQRVITSASNKNKQKMLTPQSSNNGPRQSSAWQDIIVEDNNNVDDGHDIKIPSSDASRKLEASIGKLVKEKVKNLDTLAGSGMSTLKSSENERARKTTQQKETDVLRINLRKVLKDQGLLIHEHTRRHFGHHHHHHRRHHTMKFRKLRLVVSDGEDPDNEQLSIKPNASPMETPYIDTGEDSTQRENSIFTGRATTGRFGNGNANSFDPLESFEQGKGVSAEDGRMQDQDDVLNPEGIGLKLNPESYSQHVMYNPRSRGGMFSLTRHEPKFGVPDLNPYLHREFDLETKEANDLSNRYNTEDLVEAKRLSRFEEDKIMRHAFGLPPEGHTTLGQQDSEMDTENNLQTMQQHGERMDQQDSAMLSANAQQDEARMAYLQEPMARRIHGLHNGLSDNEYSSFMDGQRPSMPFQERTTSVNEEGSDLMNQETPLATNEARESPSLFYQKKPSMINYQGLQQFPMMSAMNEEGSRDMNRANPLETNNGESLMEQGISRHRMEMPGERNSMMMMNRMFWSPQASQYVSNAYARNMFGIPPFAGVPRAPQFNAFATPELAQGNLISPLGMAAPTGQFTQASPFSYLAKRKKKKRSKTLRPRPSLPKKENNDKV